MNRRRGLLVLLIGIALSLSTVKLCYGDDATVLPKGFFRILVDTHYAFTWDERYDKEGNAVRYDAPYNVPLSTNIGLPAGLTLGNTIVNVRRNGSETLIQPAYGVTDKLSIGLIIPYYWFKTSVSASVDSSNANFGIRNTTGQPFPLIPGLSHKATTDDIQNLLQSNFSINRVQTWEKDGIGDLIAGGRYQYFNSESWRLAFTGGVRFPTGYVADPHNIVDSGLGKGDYALLFQFQQDFLRQSPGLSRKLGFPDPGEFFVNTTFRYELNLPDKRFLRVCPRNVYPFCNTFDDVQRRIGDVVEAELSPKIGIFIPGLNFSPTYKYGHKFKDQHTGDKPLDYGGLGEELDSNRTNYTEHIYLLTLTYTTIPLYVQKRFPYPLSIALTYRNRFDGSGGLPKNEYIGLAVQAFF